MSGLPRVTISLPSQTLELRADTGRLLRRFQVSTAKNGAGEQSGSYRTPRGPHIVRAKIGADAVMNTVFVRRRPTGETWSPQLAAQFPGRDWILTRILWLSGKRVGFNRLGDVDTMRRYVYLHGCPDNVPMGVPGSIGCVRMRNADIVELFDILPPYSRVDIDDFRVDCADWEAVRAVAAPLRASVFVVEQGVPAQLESDDQDATSLHAVAFAADGSPIGTARLLPDGHIGRMAVAAAWRSHGVGRALLDALTDAARERDLAWLTANAQIKAVEFYRRFGFEPFGSEFVTAGILHQAMRRPL